MTRWVIIFPILLSAFFICNKGFSQDDDDPRLTAEENVLQNFFDSLFNQYSNMTTLPPQPKKEVPQNPTVLLDIMAPYPRRPPHFKASNVDRAVKAFERRLQTAAGPWRELTPGQAATLVLRSAFAESELGKAWLVKEEKRVAAQKEREVAEETRKEALLSRAKVLWPPNKVGAENPLYTVFKNELDKWLGKKKTLFATQGSFDDEFERLMNEVDIARACPQGRANPEEHN